MCKRMTNACQREAQVVEEAWTGIASLKESFHTELTNVEDSCARVHWLLNELISARKIDGSGVNFDKCATSYMMKDP